VTNSPSATVVVVNEERIVLGRLRASRASAGGDRPVEDVMEAGLTTVRAHEPLVPLLERMARRQVDEAIVTNPEGELLGVVHRPKERS
jgi:CBS domain-containing protein